MMGELVLGDLLGIRGTMSYPKIDAQTYDGQTQHLSKQDSTEVVPFNSFAVNSPL